MNEVHYAYFDPEEIEYIEDIVEEIMQIYTAMDWEEGPTVKELEDFICDSILEIRSDEELKYIARWRVKVQHEELSILGQEISIIF